MQSEDTEDPSVVTLSREPIDRLCRAFEGTGMNFPTRVIEIERATMDLEMLVLTFAARGKG